MSQAKSTWLHDGESTHHQRQLRRYPSSTPYWHRSGKAFLDCLQDILGTSARTYMAKLHEHNCPADAKRAPLWAWQSTSQPWKSHRCGQEYLISRTGRPGRRKLSSFGIAHCPFPGGVFLKFQCIFDTLLPTLLAAVCLLRVSEPHLVDKLFKCVILSQSIDQLEGWPPRIQLEHLTRRGCVIVTGASQGSDLSTGLDWHAFICIIQMEHHYSYFFRFENVQRVTLVKPQLYPRAFVILIEQFCQPAKKEISGLEQVLSIHLQRRRALHTNHLDSSHLVNAWPKWGTRVNQLRTGVHIALAKGPACSNEQTGQRQAQ